VRITATYRITETVVNTQIHEAYFAAQMVRDKALVTSSVNLESLIGLDWGNWYAGGGNKREIYWYIISGTNVYLQYSLDFSKIESAWLEYIFPLSENIWYPDGEQRRMIPDVRAGPNSGKRGAGGPVKKHLPAGEFNNCFDILTIYLSGGTIDWFCQNIGFVGREFDHQGTSYGERTVLVDYSIRSP
jgi:hypothetical protein